MASASDDLTARLLSSFFMFGRTPWHNAPADGLSRAETSILENIQRAHRKGIDLRVSTLSSILRVSSSTVTQHLNNLERQGFVERTQATEDKRAVNLSLTEKGLTALRSHWKALENDFIKLIDHMGKENAETLIGLLNQANGFFIERAKMYETEYI